MRRSKRLEYEWLQMNRLSECCSAIKFRTLDSDEAHERYQVFYYLKTIIGVTDGKPVYREAKYPTIVEFDLHAYPFGKIIKKCIKMPPPYHPNCFLDGTWCSFKRSHIMTFPEEVINVAKTIQFDPSVTNTDVAANLDACEWWNKHKNSGLFPCDYTRIPNFIEIIPEPRISIKRNSKT